MENDRYDLEFLEEKLGSFEKNLPYPQKKISGFNLFYVENDVKDELNQEIKKIKKNENAGYIWGFVRDTGAIYVTRTFGENRVFIFNPSCRNKTDYIKGKLKVLNNLTKGTINDLFDQKAVFDYFYKTLWELRLNLGKEIRNKNDLPDNVALMEAQHIIDRVIFTYFVCEKELVTLDGHGPITGKTLFSGTIAKMDNPWDYLKDLFFEQFAKKNSKGLKFGSAVIKTPYLNGGLFRPKIIDGISEDDLIINSGKEKWQKLFEPLNKYTWIIEDKIPYLEEEYEGNLTPEIIGHIYEKFVISIEELDEINLDELNISRSGDLKKGNKKIGAYYTPENITDYISRNTIKPYLFEKLEIPNETDFEEFLNSSNPEILENASKILDEITICDPACGSGAFLIKAGEVLLEYKNSILKTLGKEKENDRYALKKEIIINNLYGVDIQEGAVEICKLRLWLWLISSSNNGKVEPLPNIEYNFKVGNSLIGWLNESITQISLHNPLTDDVKGIFKGLIAFAEDEDEELLKNAEELLKGFNLDDYIESYYFLYTVYRKTDGKKAEKLRDILEEIRVSIYNSINPAFRDHINEKIKPKYHKDNPPISEKDFNDFEPFHWRVDFGHIIKNGGFDIIIGNPPYVFTRGNHFSDAEKRFYSTKYGYNSNKGDKSRKNQSGKLNLFTLFMERSLKLLKINMFLGFIIPNNILRTTTYNLTRLYILNSCAIKEIVDLNGGIFSNVTAATIIMILKKEIEEKKISHNKVKITTNISNLRKKDYKRYLIQQKYFFKNPSYAFNIYVTSELFTIFEKIKERTIPLSNFTKNIIEGIVTPKGKSKFISYEKSSEKHKKYVEGKDIKRYYVNYKGKYVLYDPKILHRARSEEIFNCKEKILIQRISGGKRVITAAYDDQQYYTFASVNNLLINDYSSINLKYLLTLLNSNFLNVYYNLNFTNKSDLTVNISSTYLEQLPIPSVTPSEQQKFVKMAEIMIKMNKDLQKDINSFKKEIKALGTEKLSKKLEKFYELSFDDFLKELKKRNVNVAHEHDLKHKFEDSISIINPLIKEIERNDIKIDFMVYELYGLTDEEIKVIENSLS